LVSKKIAFHFSYTEPRVDGFLHLISMLLNQLISDKDWRVKGAQYN